jgi:pSer/pThr/pTyr-binding forkhead associated (FHA) protein
MWKLTIEDDEGKQTQLPLAHAEYTLGRDDKAAIRLTDRNVSRRHAALRQATDANGTAWLLRDLDSYNGTYVNGARVAEEQPVKSGDVIQIGDYRIEISDAAVRPTGPDAVTTGQFAAIHHRPDRLVVVLGPQPGQEFPLLGESYTIGRSEEASISINHASVSRIHAELYPLAVGRYEIIDKGSANGIRINGVDLRQGILEAGDALELGDVRLRYVGAGKVFRGADQSTHLLRAVSFEAAAPASAVAAAAAAPQKGPSLLKLALLGGLLGLVGLAIVLVVRTPGLVPGVSPSTEQQKQSDKADAIVKEAKKKLDAGDLEGAHVTLQDLPDGVPQRDDAVVKDVEGRWADGQFVLAEKASDVAQKRKLLQGIASGSLIDADRRKKALELLQQTAPEPTVEPTVAPVRPTGALPPATAATATASAAPSTAPVATAAPLSSDTYGPRRKALEAKVWSGKASVAEIKELKAICGHQGDKACRDRANAMLKQALAKQDG